MKTMTLNLKFYGEDGPYDIKVSCDGFTFTSSDRFLLLFEEGDVPIGCYNTEDLTGFSVSYKNNEVYGVH